jgi:phage baseplate assembly protein W
MLFITDTTGKTITSAILSFKEANGQTGVIVTISAQIHETDTSLTGRFLTASLNWNDGSASAVSFGQVSLDTLGQPFWAVSASRRLLPGTYVILLRAQNYRAPLSDVAQVNFFVTVQPGKAPYIPQSLIFGPVLPRDSGFPNNQQWEFQLDSDIIILESSVKMLLLTAKGDRVMVPDYGTNIRRLLFEANISSIESLLREEIISAFAVWEPRVDLANINLTRDVAGRSITLDLTLVSKLTKQPFQTSVEFVR